MKLEMTTDFLDLIDPGSYGTHIGDLLDCVTDKSVDNFFDCVLRCGMYQINDILSDPLIVESFGKCKASNGKIVRPQFYNYQNDAIEFDLEVPDKTIEKIRHINITDHFSNGQKIIMVHILDLFHSFHMIKSDFIKR